MLLCCFIQDNTRCNVTAGVLLKSMTQRALLEENLEIEITDDFDFEAIKTSDAAERQSHGAGRRCKTEKEEYR